MKTKNPRINGVEAETPKAVYACDLCEELIAKYQLDVKCCEIKVSGGTKLICDRCAKLIAEFVVEEF